MNAGRSATRIDAAIAIVLHAGKVLICRRSDHDSFGGYWEFPGGKRRPGESLEACLARELDEELAIRARPLFAFEAIEHDYPDLLVRLHPFLCRHLEGDPRCIGCQETRWIAPPELRDFRFPPANAALIEEIIRHLTPEQ